MELEELKAGWNVLNERLEQNEILNKRIIKEMITKRTVAARDRLLRCCAGGIIFLLLVGTVILMTRGKTVVRPEAEVIVWSAIIVAFVYSVLSYIFLSRFDLERCSLTELRSWTIKLKRMLRLELIFTIVFVSIAFVSIFFIHHHYRSVQQMLVDVMLILLITVGGYLGYKNVDKKSVEEIEKGLQELKEFEEEPDQNKSE